MQAVDLYDSPSSREVTHRCRKENTENRSYHWSRYQLAPFRSAINQVAKDRSVNELRYLHNEDLVALLEEESE